MAARPIHFYLSGTASWFMAFAMQGVLFAWLVTMVLRESPEMVGLAQMTLLLPGTLLILVGGSYADRFGGRRVAIVAQLAAASAVLYLLVVVGSGRLSLPLMLGYAVLMGCAQAFVTPARDGLLSQVAEGRVQRTVMLASFMQFGVQMIGFLLAGMADRIGAVIILAVQLTVLLAGVFAFARIPEAPKHASAAPSRLARSVVEGARTVFSSSSMRMVMLQNVAMGMFFMGSYVVTMPLLVRETFAGSAQDLAITNGANSLGLVLTIVLLLRLGDVRHQGRALLLAQGIGAAVLAAAGFAGSFAMFALGLFIWGVCGGVAMTMSRTIMQEQAPEFQRARVMSFYSFSFMGAGPVGALLNGYLVELLGAQLALLTASLCMLAVVTLVGLLSDLWRLEGHVHQTLPAGQRED